MNDQNTLGLTRTEWSGVVVEATASEIYVARCRNQETDPLPLRLARTAFHESMHNQLAQGDAMHAGKTGFAAAVPAGASPNAVNLALMAGSIATLRPQWVDGFQAWRSNSQSVR